MAARKPHEKSWSFKAAASAEAEEGFASSASHTIVKSLLHLSHLPIEMSSLQAAQYAPEDLVEAGIFGSLSVNKWQVVLQAACLSDRLQNLSGGQAACRFCNLIIFLAKVACHNCDAQE